MWLGCTEKFVKSDDSKVFWRKGATVSLVAFILLTLINRLAGDNLTNITWISHWGIAMGLPANFMMMTFFVSLFMLCWWSKDRNGYAFQRFPIPFGRMSLTNYITQSIIGVVLFYNFGFGLYRVCGATLSVAIGLGVIIVLTAVSRCWLKSHRQGPLEWLWKRLTWI